MHHECHPSHKYRTQPALLCSPVRPALPPWPRLFELLPNTLFSILQALCQAHALAIGAYCAPLVWYVQAHACCVHLCCVWYINYAEYVASLLHSVRMGGMCKLL